MDEQVSLTSVRHDDGYAPIGDYAVLGDGRGAALVAADGSVDWWAVRRLDSPPAFAALLDPERGGSIELRPADADATVTRRYVAHTNQLQTTFTTVSGEVVVTDSLNSGSAGPLPWSELARRVEGIGGTVELELAIRPGDGLRAWEPWVEDDPRGPILHAGTITLGVRCSPEITLATTHEQVSGSFTVEAGQRRLVGIVASDADPLFLCDVASIDHRVDVTSASWRQWVSQVNWHGAGREQILRSALALKTLVITETGATAAAATTSLPESVGGPKNWDTASPGSAMPR